MEFRTKESKKQEHRKARLKMHRPTHQSPPNATEYWPQNTEISWKQNSWMDIDRTGKELTSLYKNLWCLIWFKKEGGGI